MTRISPVLRSSSAEGGRICTNSKFSPNGWQLVQLVSLGSSSPHTHTDGWGTTRIGTNSEFSYQIRGHWCNSCHTVVIRVHPWSNPSGWRDLARYQRDFARSWPDLPRWMRDFPRSVSHQISLKSRQISANLAKTRVVKTLADPNRLPISSNSVFNP